MKHFSHGRAQSRERASLLPREESTERIIASHQPIERKEGMPPSIRATIPFAQVDEQLLATYGEAKNEPENDPLAGLSTPPTLWPLVRGFLGRGRRPGRN